MITEKYEQNLKKDLLDPLEAPEYLNAAFEDGNIEIFLTALKDVAGSKGISEIPRETRLNRKNLYSILATIDFQFKRKNMFNNPVSFISPP